MVHGLCLQLRCKDGVRGEALVILLEMDQAKTRIEALEFESPLLVARPLPSGVDPLGIEDMVRRQQKARCEELEQALVFAIAFPHRHRNVSSCKSFKIQPQFWRIDEVILKRGSVDWLGCIEVSQEGLCTVLSEYRIR